MKIFGKRKSGTNDSVTGENYMELRDQPLALGSILVSTDRRPPQRFLAIFRSLKTTPDLWRPFLSPQNPGVLT